MCVIEKDAAAVKRHVEDSNDDDDADADGKGDGDGNGDGDEYAKKSC